MRLLPALDLRDGQVVRLEQGDDSRRTVYERVPERVARRYAEAGAAMVHVVDLDAAFGEAPQRALIERLASLDDGPKIQLGGGLRDREAVEWALGVGCQRVVMTSLLVRDFDLFASLAEQYPQQLVAALDVLDGELRTAGWLESAGRDLDRLCRDLEQLPIAAVLVTDIQRDGMLSGPNLDLACELGRLAGTPAILSGGVSTLADLETASRAAEIESAVVGKALFDGRIDLHRALEVCSGGLKMEAAVKR